MTSTTTNTASNAMSAWLSFNRWLPERFRSLPDHAEALRIRFFLLMVLLCIVPLALLFPGLLFIIITGHAEYWVPTLGVGVIALAQSACLYYFLKTGHINTSSVIYSAIIFILIGITAFNTGGWHSPLCSFMLALPVITCLVVNRITGIIFSVITLLLYTALYLLDQRGYHFNQWLPGSYIGYANIMMWFTTMGFLIGCLVLFDLSTEDLSRNIQLEQIQWQKELDQDELTTALTASAFTEQAQRLAQRATTGDMGIISIHIGNLKAINQDHGFDAGDRVLKTVVHIIFDLVQTSDALVSRYYPDTLVIFIPDICDIGVFLSLRLKLGNALDRLVIMHDGISLPRDFRLGSVVTGERNIPVEELVVRAGNQYQPGNRYPYTRT